MDKSTPRWVMMEPRPHRFHTHRIRKLDPLKHCSDTVSHYQLIKAMKNDHSKEEPNLRTFHHDIRRIPLTVSNVKSKSVVSPPSRFKTGGSLQRHIGFNNHYESKDANGKVLDMLQRRKRALYTAQHEIWSLPIYGNFAQREQYMKDYRGYLKSQMNERDWRMRQEFNKSLQGAKRSYEVTRSELEKEQKDVLYKKQNQVKFRDENKKLMEAKEALRRSQQEAERLEEKQLIRINPINPRRKVSASTLNAIANSDKICMVMQHFIPVYS